MTVFSLPLTGIPATYRQVNSSQISPYDISELWTSLKLGDSVITTQLLDTFIKRDPQSIPPKFKKGDKIITYAKVLAIFKTDTAAQADYEKTNKDWLSGEMKTIEKFLADKKLTATKTPSGAFVQMLNPGSGNDIDSGKYVSVRYTGTSWSGKVFDSNTDTVSGVKPAMPFTVGTGSMIKGFDEAVMLMKLGSKAKVLYPFNSRLCWTAKFSAY
ncbi:MAG: FKBP-type peptidyl-prolyl cis-trans isomerase [Chitinophagaceae bacterium]